MKLLVTLVVSSKIRPGHARLTINRADLDKRGNVGLHRHHRASADVKNPKEEKKYPEPLNKVGIAYITIIRTLIVR
ncbi:unnamed protein product [Linum trigynum]|uniref:Uncharacterized protein n=1 Tax=Linum trigynum TaxID=586398 RepID=A0AAV2D361_9ROSI